MKSKLIKIACIFLAALNVFLIASMVIQLNASGVMGEGYSPYAYTCPIGTEHWELNKGAVVLADYLNVRSYPSTQSLTSTVLKEGETLLVIASFEDWVLVRRDISEFILGWVNSEYISFTENGGDAF